MSEFLKFPKIDVHAHYLPDTYYDAMNKYLGGNPDKFPTPTWSPEGHVEWLEKMGISYAVVSVSSPHINFSTPEINKEIVRRCNEDGAELAQKYPGKFGILASLPIPDVEGTIEEIVYASDVLQVDGFTLPTNSRGTYICEPKFEPVFEEL